MPKTFLPVCRAAVAAFVVLAGAATSAADDSHAVAAPVFGPQTFSRAKGGPATETATFPANSLISGPYFLVITTDGRAPGHLAFNGTDVYGPKDKGSRIVRPVSLLEVNTIDVVLTGKPGTSIAVSVVGYQYEFAGDYANLPLLSSGITILADTVDWRTKGVVTGVKDQGQCQADWGFSATGAAEGAWAIDKGQLVSLSEQALIDCPLPTLASCADSSPAAGLQFAIDEGGFPSAQSYPYTASVEQCQAYTPIVTLSSQERIPPGDDAALAAAVQSAPVSVVLDGGWLDSCTGGVATPACGSTPPQFVAALIVGYGESGGQPYNIVKASRGIGFGESGYFRIVRGSNACGIANFAVVPIV